MCMESTIPDSEFLGRPQPEIKNRISLTRTNVMEEVTRYQKENKEEHGILALKTALLNMVQSGEYYASGEWVMPRVAGRGMNKERASAVWKMMTHPSQAQPRDVDLVFFTGDGHG